MVDHKNWDDFSQENFQNRGEQKIGPPCINILYKYLRINTNALFDIDFSGHFYHLIVSFLHSFIATSNTIRSKSVPTIIGLLTDKGGIDACDEVR